jgi:hypothetical protein
MYVYCTVHIYCRLVNVGNFIVQRCNDEMYKSRFFATARFNSGLWVHGAQSRDVGACSASEPNVT